MTRASLRLALVAIVVLWGALSAAPPAEAQTYKVLTTCGTAVYTNGTFNYPTMDASGNICNNGSGGGGGAVTIADGADVTLGAKADSAWVSGSGTVVSVLKGIFGNTAAAIPAGSAIIGKVGIDQTTPGTTNGVQTLSGSTTAVTGSVAVTGTFWQATQPVSGTVTANAGTNLNTSALALDTSVNGLLLAQGSTTSGQKGPIALGAVTTGSPTYTTAQSSPLSLTTAGALRTDASATTQPVSGTVTANAGSGTFNIQSNASVNVAQVNGVTTLTGAGATGTGSQRNTVAQDTTTIAGSAPGTAGTASANVLTVQGIASMTKLLVTPDSVALPANQSVNVSQFGGTNVVTGTGASGAGIPRVTVSNDSTVILGTGSATVGALTADTHAQCSALCANLVVKASAGVLKTFEVSADSTLSGAIWYVIVYDATSAPVDGAITPAKCYQQASGTTQMGGSLGPGGTNYTTGVTIGVSTTGCFTKTASTHAFIAADYQ